MPPENNTQLPSPPTETPKRYNKRLLILLALLLLGLAGAIAIAIKYNGTDNDDKTEPYVGKITPAVYQNLEEYQLKGENSGNGISFIKPSELKPLAADQETANLVRLVHQATQKSSGGSIITASISPATTPPSQEYLTALGTTLTNPESSGHTEAIKPTKAFIEGEYTNYVVELGEFTAFTNSTIKENAWRADFTGTDDAHKSSGIPVKGTVLFMAGQNTYYYFLVGSIEDNWQSNQAVWEKVLDSLKINL